MSRAEEFKAALAARKLTFDETEYLINRVERLEKALLLSRKYIPFMLGTSVDTLTKNPDYQKIEETLVDE